MKRIIFDNESRVLLRIKETEEVMGLSHQTIYRLIGKGDLDAVKIGRSTRIPVASIEKFVNRLLRN